MKSERWDRIEEIFHAALLITPVDRDAFLTTVCGGDTNLRDEIQSLISAYELPGDFLEQSQLSAALHLYAARDAATLAGEIVGPYTLRNRIGRGGMGDVYLALDNRLGRHVALKLLPTSMGSDSEWIARFQQEARASSSISHPNIAHMYEVGEFAGRQYIAMEFVEGLTLREHLKRGISVDQAIEIALQVVRALASAHEAGVLHRDVKPENIMLRSDGFVKILDFGLAKVNERTLSSANSQTVSVDTTPGLVIGTLSYMSPEQARGTNISAQSDIWSVGVVLYEMFTGQKPFDGETPSDILAAILLKEPPAITNIREELTPELDGIVRKALNKDPTKRHTDMYQLGEELRILKTKMDSGGWNRGDGLNKTFPVTHLNEGSSVKSSVQPFWLGIKGLRWQSRLPLAVGVMALVMGSILWLNGPIGFELLARRWRHPAVAKQPFRKMTVLKFTNGGASQPQISPNGRYVAYAASCEKGRPCVWLRDLNTGASKLLLPSSENNYWALSFSRDGQSLYYNQKKLNDFTEYYTSDLYQIPLMGGTPHKIMANVNSGVTPSPDNKQLAFIRVIPNRQENALITVDSDGTSERVLAIKKWPELCWNPSWSPDGKLIAYGVRNRDGNKFYNSIMAAPVAGGSEFLLTQNRWTDVGPSFAWLGDGKHLTFSAKDRVSDPFQLYVLSYPDGEVRRITNDVNSYTQLGITEDSSTLVAQFEEVSSDIWIRSQDESQLRRITTAGKAGIGGLSWTPDGRIVYASLSRESYSSATATGDNAIWIVDSDGKNQRQLTFSEGLSTNPSVTRDGKHIVFASNRGGVWGIWTMDIDGGNPRQIVSGGTTSNPSCSPDGSWVVFKRLGESGSPKLWKVPLIGGTAVELNDQYAYPPAVSPDGKFIAFFSPSEKKNRLVVISSETGNEIKAFEPTALTANFQFFAQIVRWSHDGRSINYIDSKGDVSNVWRQPFGNGAPKQLTDFASDSIYSFDWSPDGRSLALARGQMNGQIVLIKDLEP